MTHISLIHDTHLPIKYISSNNTHLVPSDTWHTSTRLKSPSAQCYSVKSRVQYIFYTKKVNNKFVLPLSWQPSHNSSGDESCIWVIAPVIRAPWKKTISFLHYLSVKTGKGNTRWCNTCADKCKPQMWAATLITAIHGYIVSPHTASHKTRQHIALPRLFFFVGERVSEDCASHLYIRISR